MGGFAHTPPLLPPSSTSSSPAPSPLLSHDKLADGKHVVTHVSLPVRGSH